MGTLPEVDRAKRRFLLRPGMPQLAALLLVLRGESLVVGNLL